MASPDRQELVHWISKQQRQHNNVNSRRHLKDPRASSHYFCRSLVVVGAWVSALRWHFTYLIINGGAAAPAMSIRER